VSSSPRQSPIACQGLGLLRACFRLPPATLHPVEDHGKYHRTRVEPRFPTTTNRHIPNAPTLVSFPYSRREKESKGIGAPGFPGMFPVPTGRDLRLSSPQSAAVISGSVENTQVITYSGDRTLTPMGLSCQVYFVCERILISYQFILSVEEDAPIARSWVLS
jgi:hypothetical protein